MFWEFGIVSSEIDEILDNECDTTLVTLLNESDLLQELNSRNSRLIDYFSREENIDTLFTYIIMKPDESLDESSRFKYPMLCCELLTAGISSFDNIILENPDYLTRLFDTFNDDSINILICNYVVKLFVYLVGEHFEQIYQFIISNNIQIVDIFLKHIQYTSVCDAILKIQSHELAPNIRSQYIDLLNEQDIIGKLYSLIQYEISNEVKSAACNIFVEIIRIHRIRPTFFMDNFKFTENMTMIDQAQSNNHLLLLLENMFLYTNMDSNDIDNKLLWEDIDKTINYGCIMLLALFDTIRINDIYGDELNEMGYIRNNILIVISTDFTLLAHYIGKFVDYLIHTVDIKMNNYKNDPTNRHQSNVLSFGVTNINIVRFLCILTIFQSEILETSLIKTNILSLLWKYIPYFKQNNALHSLVFDTISFILLSDIYRNSPKYLAQNSLRKDSVISHLKYRFDFSSLPPTIFHLGRSTLLYEYLVDDVQILIILLELYETYCTTIQCSYRGHMMQLLARLSKSQSTQFMPKNPDSTMLSSIWGKDIDTSTTDASSNYDVLKHKWESCCNTSISQYIKDNEIDPNVITVATSFNDDNFDNLFKTFDLNVVQSSDDHNGSFSYNDADKNSINPNIKIDVEQGLAYMESVKQSLLFGNSNAKFQDYGNNGKRNSFVCSSDDEDYISYGSDDKLPSFEDDNTQNESKLFRDNNNDTLATTQTHVSDCIDTNPQVNSPGYNLHTTPQDCNIARTAKPSRRNPADLLCNPYDNVFEFGGKNSQYIESVITDQISSRLTCVDGTDHPFISNIIDDKSYNSIVCECDTTNKLATLSITDNTEESYSANDVETDNQLKSSLTELSFKTPSMSIQSGSEIFYSCSSTSELNEIQNNFGCHIKENTFTFSVSDEILKPVASSIQCETGNSPLLTNDTHDVRISERKGTSSPTKLSFSSKSDNDNVLASTSSSISNPSDSNDEVPPPGPDEDNEK